MFSKKISKFTHSLYILWYDEVFTKTLSMNILFLHFWFRFMGVTQVRMRMYTYVRVCVFLLLFIHELIYVCLQRILHLRKILLLILLSKVSIEILFYVRKPGFVKPELEWVCYGDGDSTTLTLRIPMIIKFISFYGYFPSFRYYWR